MHRFVGLVLWLTVGVVAPASAVAAQTADYPGGTTAEVQGETFTREQGGSGGGSQVAGTQASRAGLAVTGADVAQLGVMGAALVAGGTVLVRRSRRRHGATSAPAES